MEPVKIRGTWRWYDANGNYYRGTDEEYQTFLAGNPIEVAATPIEQVYADGLFEQSGNEPA